MNKTCTQCSAGFEIIDADLAFLDEISPVFEGKKYAIPAPVLCPDCRMQRRMAWRNDRTLHHRKSDLSGKQIISMYSPDKPYKVYEQDEWWSDRWDAMAFGRPFDFNKTFQEQFDALSVDVPHQSLYSTNAQNSLYTNHSLNAKDCYLIGGLTDSENCLYGRFIISCKNVVDSASVVSSEWCYEGVASQHCYNCAYFIYSRNCSDCVMIEDCQGCRNCIACFGLKNAEYCIANERLSKEEYEKRKAELGELTQETVSLMRQKLNAIKTTLPHRYAQIFASEECSGDMIFGSKNCRWCFDVSDCEDCSHVAFTTKGRRSMDATFTAPDGVQFCYDVGSTVGVQRALFTFLAWYGSNIILSTECHQCNDCLGCVGLRRKQYCIFNMQYTKEEYEKLAGQIITHMQKTGEWGQYMPVSSSRFCYNESVAFDYYPLIKEEVLARGWKWHDEEQAANQYLGKNVEPPATISQTTDDITKQILRCTVTGKLYKITPQELTFYRKLNIPVPTKCPDERHKERLALRNPRHLWERECVTCKNPISTTYSPDRPEIVVCETCYRSSAY